jgi:hypothetical protein
MLEREDGVYRNTADTDFFLDRAKPSYMGGMLEMCNVRLYGFWGSLTEALRTGEPQNEAKEGRHFFGALYAEPQRLREFLGAMSGLSAGAAQAIAALEDIARDERTLTVINGSQIAAPFENSEDYRHLCCMSEEFDPTDYSFVVKRRGSPAKPWRWEIYRAGRSGPVECSPGFFESMAEAAKEGKKALGRLLAKQAA